MIFKVLPLGPLDTNSIIIGSKKSGVAIVIDVPPQGSDHISSELKKLGLKLEKILITHSHWDHIGDVAQLKKEFNVPVLIHKLDKDNLEKPGLDKIPGVGKLEGVVADGYLEEGQKIPVGEIMIKVIETPGHTAGSVCFYIEKENILVSGDTLFCGTMGAIHFPGSKPDLMWKSLKKLAKLPPNTEVYPGHGEPTTIGAEAWLEDAQEIYFQGE